MSSPIFGAFLLFAIVALITPGPNNVMLLSSGLNFGFRGAQPHVWGVTLGFAFMVLVVGLGLGAIFDRFPALYTIVKYGGAAYLLYLAWHIAVSGPIGETGGLKGRPISFFHAVAFQWINPKAWVMAVGAVSTYAAIAGYPQNVLLMAGLFAVFGIGSSFIWVSFGTGLRRFVSDPRAVRVFNIVMALALVVSLYPVLAEAWT